MIPTFLHLLERGTEAFPAAFTFPFRYTPHPLCRRAALIVQEKLQEMGVEEGKMYGVLIVRRGEGLFFLAAYSGQLNGSYNHPWFVPPVVDYLSPDSYFQQEQRAIMAIGNRMNKLKDREERKECQRQVMLLRGEREAAVNEAKHIYSEGKVRREQLRPTATADMKAALIHESQQQKADIQRAKQLHKEEIADLEERLATHNATIHALNEERKERSEALQQWLFSQFNFLNAHGEQQNLTSLFQGRFIPSGAGECCAPKLLQTAYLLGLQPLAMAEFWWGSSSPTHYRAPGAFFPACRSKCHPILGHMLQGLNVEPDPALHYENRELPPVSIIWEDEHLAVIAKPEGWVSIPGRSDQPCIIDECYRLWPHIKGSVVVHRLDQDTSGLMVIAKNARMHHILSQQFERREVHKRYVALLDTPQLDRPPRFTLSLPLAPDLDNMPRRRVDFLCGKEAITDCEVVGKEQHGIRDVTRIIFYPHTGRTHQLRVHASSPIGLNAPILGDRLYGLPDERLFLHAEMLEFEHPATHEHLLFELPAPF
ncbi:MAG: RNA pseudouridine synthase [Bacteroidaceae bacterium]|nr:RNA pseudouridine synthase [Bacteroidaceae bacterium]